MGRKIAVDFGTTNTVVAEWIEGLDQPQTLRLDGLTAPPLEGSPPLIPSLLYVQDGKNGQALAGWSVRAGGYDVRGDKRFFASFKRGIAARHRPFARDLDGEPWDEARAGHRFLQAVLEATAEMGRRAEGADAEAEGEDGLPVEELVLTVPIQAFERYLAWLTDAALSLPARRLRIVDEPTAAALGYEVREPDALVLVFDFGGGTLDIALVRTPALGEGGPGVIYDVQSGHARRRAPGLSQPDSSRWAVVVAKAGQMLGGDDIDHWLIDDLYARHGVTRESAAGVYPQLRREAEALKIRLSSYPHATLAVFDADAMRTYHAAYTRAELEDLLDARGFFDKIQATIDKVLRAARQHGIHKEDIAHVLMVGGTSLMPAVRRLVRMNFGDAQIHQDRPFTAVAHGALSLAVGVKLDDFLYHSYGLRHLSPVSSRHEYYEIIPAGTRYPIEKPIEVTLCASRNGQEAIEMVIGEVEEGGTDLAEVYFGEHQIVLVENGSALRRVIPLNDREGARTIARLDPPGKAGRDRIRVEFTVDSNRALRVTVRDLSTRRLLLDNEKVVSLR